MFVRLFWFVLCRLTAEEARNRGTPQSTEKWDAVVAAAALALADLTQASVVRKPVAGVDAVTEGADATGSLSADRLPAVRPPADKCPEVRQGLTGGVAAEATGAELGIGKQQPERLSEPEAPASRGKQPAAKRHKASSLNPDLGARGEMNLCSRGQSGDTGAVHATCGEF